jgi:soluble lytic murein transglycosylase-like protein
MNARTLIGVLFVGCIGMANARADIFVFTDDNGTPHFSDVPNDARYQFYLRSEQPATQVNEAQKIPATYSQNRDRFTPEIRRAASLYQIDEALLHAVIAVESGYNTRIISKKGAVGLMQLMPDTAKRFKVNNSFDPAQNIRAGAQYLSKLLAQFDNNTQLALAAYNAGESNVRKYGGHIPPFAETIAYVPKVMGLYEGYRQALR